MRKLGKIIALLLLLATAATPFLALAEGAGVTTQIPFTVLKTPGTVVIEAVSEGAPMPDPARFPQVNDGAFEITFTQPGNYFYKVFEQEGRDGLEYYDATEYDVGAYVMNDADGGLNCTVIVSIAGDTRKPDGIEFTNPPPTTLAISKVAKRGGEEVEEVFAGDEIVYEIEVRNIGRNKAYNVEVIDTLPIQRPLLTVTGISDGGELVQDGKAVRWAFEELNAGESVIVRITVEVPAINADVTWVNRAQVIHDDPEDPDAEWPTAQAEITEGKPHVTIDKVQARNDGARTRELLYVDAGDVIVYYITMRNDSKASALNAVITDEIPDGLTLTPGTISSGGTLSGRVITWRLGDLAPGESVTVSFGATVPTVTQRTYWTNQAFGEYIDGSWAQRDGILGSLNTSGQKVDLRTDKVQAVTDPEGSGSSANTPKTGDDTRLWLWLALLLASLTGIAGALIVRRRRNRRSE